MTGYENKFVIDDRFYGKQLQIKLYKLDNNITIIHYIYKAADYQPLLLFFDRHNLAKTRLKAGILGVNRLKCHCDTHGKVV